MSLITDYSADSFSQSFSLKVVNTPPTFATPLSQTHPIHSVQLSTIPRLNKHVADHLMPMSHQSHIKIIHMKNGRIRRRARKTKKKTKICNKYYKNDHKSYNIITYYTAHMV